MERLEEEIAMKRLMIKELETKLYGILHRKPRPAAMKNQIYEPLKGDEIDCVLAEYINAYGTLVPWKRIGPTRYMYGSKQVSVKYLRKHLII